MHRYNTFVTFAAQSTASGYSARAATVFTAEGLAFDKRASELPAAPWTRP
jgi:hypothetical protein